MTSPGLHAIGVHFLPSKSNSVSVLLAKYFISIFDDCNWLEDLPAQFM